LALSHNKQSRLTIAALIALSFLLFHTYTIQLVNGQAADFTINANPTNMRIVQGESATFALSVTALILEQNITLVLYGIPAGASAFLDPQILHLVPGKLSTMSATLRVQTDTHVKPGIYDIEITALTISIAHSVSVSLEILSLNSAVQVGENGWDWLWSQRESLSLIFGVIGFSGSVVGAIIVLLKRLHRHSNPRGHNK